MATIGVFALNLSPQTGGVYNFIDGLMAHARHSRYNYIYMTQSPVNQPPPPNVEVIERISAARLLTQAMLRVPRVGWLLRRHAGAVAALASCTGIAPSIFRSADAWLWPHCFAPVPNLQHTIAICHDLIHLHHPENFSPAARARRTAAELSLPNCAAVLCPSQATATDLLQLYPNLLPQVRLFAESPCEILDAAAHVAESQRLTASYGNIPLFLFVGVDWPHKNHQLLIDAAILLRRLTTTPFKIVFAGWRRSTAIATALIGNPECLPVVEDLGSVSRQLLAALYRRATALVFPSLCEGFGIPLVEAMQYGFPIIASDQSCIPEICGDAAVILSPAQPALWAQHMLQLMIDRAYHAQLAAAAQARGHDYTWQRTWQQIDEAFAAILDGDAK